MEIIPIKTKKLLKNPLAEIFKIIKNKLRNGDVLVITSKIISYQENQLKELKKIKASKKAIKLAKKYSISLQLAELIIQEADKILGGVKNVVLTLKNGILMANAGIDLSNVPEGWVALLPKNIEASADKLKKKIKKISGKNVGVIISDSVCLPLRRGTHHFALAISGFKGIIDERGKKDLFGKKMRLTTRNIADEIASAAGLIMGERNEKIPVVIIRGFPIKFSNLSAKKLTKKLIILRNQDLFKNILRI